MSCKSDADFISKLEGGLQELEETAYWLELLTESNIFPADRLKPLYEEAHELIAMLVTMVKNVKSKSGRINNEFPNLVHPSSPIPHPL